MAAITTVERVDANSAANFGTGAYSPAAFTPAAGTRLLAVSQLMTNNLSIDVGPDMTVADTQTLTWSPIGDVAATPTYAIACKAWISSVVPSATSTTVSFDCGTRNIYTYFGSVLELTNADGTTAGFVEDSTGVTDGALTYTLGATPASDDLCVCVSFVDQSSGALTPSAANGSVTIPHSLFVSGGGDSAVAIRTGLTSTSFAVFADRRTSGISTFKGVDMAFIVKASTGAAAASPMSRVYVAPGLAATQGSQW